MTISKMEDLKGHMCRWPHGDPRNKDKFHFCGDRRDQGSPYCHKHEHIARRGSEAAKAQAQTQKAA